MSILFRILGTILITLAFIVCLLAFIYVISIELYELLEVDVLHKLKNIVRRWAYGQSESTRKVVERMFTRRKSRGQGNRKIYTSIKRRLREKAFEQKAIQSKKKKTERVDR